VQVGNINRPDDKIVSYDEVMDQFEVLTDEFYALFVFHKDRDMNRLLEKVGLTVNDDGRWKYKRPIFREEVESVLTAWWKERIIDQEKMMELLDGLASGKVTRFKIQTELKKIRRDKLQ